MLPLTVIVSLLAGTLVALVILWTSPPVGHRPTWSGLVGALWPTKKSTKVVVRSACEQWALSPSDVAQHVLHHTGLHGSALLSCVNRHWHAEARGWRQRVQNAAFSKADQARADDESIRTIARDCCASLREVDLSGCRLVGGVGVSTLAACALLEELKLPDLFIDGKLPWSQKRRHQLVEAADLVRVAEGCPRLAKLTGPCSSLDNEALRAFGRYCAALRVLVLAQCPSVHVTDEGLMALASGCPRLEEVDVTGGQQGAVTDCGIMALARGCAQLEHLNASYSLLTDLAVGALAECANLEEINLSRCPLLTDASLVAFGQRGCPRLRYLNVGMSTQMSLAAFDTFVERCPHLVNLGYGMLIYEDPHHSHDH